MSKDPPIAAAMRPNRSMAAPEAMAVTISLSPESRPASARRRAPSAIVRSWSRGAASRSPARTRRQTSTSTALPMAGQSGASMSVTRAAVGTPAPLAVATRARASSMASASVFMNAPEPAFTSSTSPSSPAASFLDRMEAVMRSTDSTVAVTSRTA
jgi:hypothetical protein